MAELAEIARGAHIEEELEREEMERRQQREAAEEEERQREMYEEEERHRQMYDEQLHAAAEAEAYARAEAAAAAAYAAQQASEAAALAAAEEAAALAAWEAAEAAEAAETREGGGQQQKLAAAALMAALGHEAGSQQGTPKSSRVYGGAADDGMPNGVDVNGRGGNGGADVGSNAMCHPPRMARLAFVGLNLALVMVGLACLALVVIASIPCYSSGLLLLTSCLGVAIGLGAVPSSCSRRQLLGLYCILLLPSLVSSAINAAVPDAPSADVGTPSGPLAALRKSAAAASAREATELRNGFAHLFERSGCEAVRDHADDSLSRRQLWGGSAPPSAPPPPLAALRAVHCHGGDAAWIGPVASALCTHENPLLARPAWCSVGVSSNATEVFCDCAASVLSAGGLLSMPLTLALWTAAAQGMLLSLALYLLAHGSGHSTGDADGTAAAADPMGKKQLLFGSAAPAAVQPRELV